MKCLRSSRARTRPRFHMDEIVKIAKELVSRCFLIERGMASAAMVTSVAPGIATTDPDDGELERSLTAIHRQNLLAPAAPSSGPPTAQTHLTLRRATMPSLWQTLHWYQGG